MSPDPALAPIGGMFRNAADTLAAFVKAHVHAGSDPVDDVRSLFSHGTPIRLRRTSSGADILTLQTVSTAEIDSHRFDLPGPVTDANAFLAAITPPTPRP